MGADAHIGGMLAAFRVKSSGRLKTRFAIDGRTAPAGDLAACSAEEREGALVTADTQHYASPVDR